MPPHVDRRQPHFWRPDTHAVTGMLRVEHEDLLKTTYSEHFVVVAVYAGAFDGWYRGKVRTHVAGAVKLKEPGEVHRGLRVHAPFTLQGAAFSPLMASAADALGLRGPLHFKAHSFGSKERASQFAFAMHAALVQPHATELERSAHVVETLRALLGDDLDSDSTPHAPRPVRRARAFLHDALAEKITLDALATHAGLDKFHLVRTFRAEVGLPPYEYLTHVRVWRARELLDRGAQVGEAAQAVGFFDQSQLHRHFRRIVGIAPGRFARQHRPSAAGSTGAHLHHDRLQPHGMPISHSSMTRRSCSRRTLP